MVNLCLKVLKLVNISVVTGKEQMKYSCCSRTAQRTSGEGHYQIYVQVMDEARTAIKRVELDAILGDTREFKEIEEEEFQIRLYTCKGKRAVRLKQVPFSRSILNHDDVFILDTKDKILQFNGANSNIQERAKALEVIQLLKDDFMMGRVMLQLLVCEYAI
ncbi:villin-2-like [Rutidosis leptorrhynchoides]|uniref:villin-2-like n=1 Tax=Rutidosis leptorrhynchoides TaxID=125765 RepID=UPI003A99B52C